MATKKGSDNRFPVLRLTYEDDTPATPPADEGHIVVGVDKVPRFIDDDGTLTELGVGGALTEITDIPTAETDTDLVLHPDGAGGVEWAADATGGGSGTAIGCRVRRAAGQTFGTSGTSYDVDWDTEDWDTDTMHYTSAAACTGTVTKTASSATLTGSGTLFTSELSVGQVISVPGTAAEKRVVTAIASDTSLTVNANFANSASGQTATRLRSAIVFRTAGKYIITGQVGYAANSGTRYAQMIVQSGATRTEIQVKAENPITGAATVVPVHDIYNAAQWDFVEMIAIQFTGGSNTSETTAGYQPTMAVTHLGT
jgi:hypothetical protein